MKLAHVLLGAGRLETWGFPRGSAVKNLPVMEKTQETSGRFPGGGMATHSSILAWSIPWKEESGRLQSMGSQRVGYN